MVLDETACSVTSSPPGHATKMATAAFFAPATFRSSSTPAPRARSLVSTRTVIAPALLAPHATSVAVDDDDDDDDDAADDDARVACATSASREARDRRREARMRKRGRALATTFEPFDDAKNGRLLLVFMEILPFRTSFYVHSTYKI